MFGVHVPSSEHSFIHPLVHINQKRKIAPKIAAKIASVNGPLYCHIWWIISKGKITVHTVEGVKFVSHYDLKHD
jgi:hypothetical protein